MATRATHSTGSSLPRYYHAVLALTCVTAICGIYYLRASAPPPQPSLRRRNAVHRHRNRTRGDTAHHEPVETPRAADAFQMLLEDEENSRSWTGNIPIVIGSGLEEANLWPSHREAETRRLQESLALPEDEREGIAFSLEQAFLETFFRRGFPRVYVIGDLPGEEEWIIQRLVMIGCGRSQVKSAIHVHNILAATSGDPVSPQADGAVETSAVALANDEQDTDVEVRSVHSWRPGNGTPPTEPRGVLALLYHIAEDQARRDGFVHRGVTCNHCGTAPILGIRYRCSNCIDFDLCETCEAQGVHTKTHVFYKVRLPAPFLGNPRNTQQVWYPGKPISFPRDCPPSLVTRIMKETCFEKSEMDALWEQFKCLASVPWPDDPNGIKMAIDRRNFDTCFVPNTLVGCPQENLIYDRMFRFYDTNNDRLIGFEEFIKGLACLNNKNKDEKMRRVFQGYDSDEDGFVSRIDFLRMFRAFYVLTKELTRDAVAGMEDDYGENQPLDAVIGSQAISGTFNGPDIGDSIVPSQPTVGKHLIEDSVLIVPSLEESEGDTGDRNRVIEDAALRALRAAARAELGAEGPGRRRSRDSDDSSTVPEPIMDVYEAMGGRRRSNLEQNGLPAEDSHQQQQHQQQVSDPIIDAAQLAEYLNGGGLRLHERPGLSEGVRQVLQTLENNLRSERMSQLERASTEVVQEAMRIEEQEMGGDYTEDSMAEGSRPSSPEELRGTARSLRAEMGDEHAFERLPRATSPEIRSMLADDSDPHELSRNATAEEVALVHQLSGQSGEGQIEIDPLELPEAESSGPNRVDLVATLRPGTQRRDIISSSSSSDSESYFGSSWPVDEILPEDIVSALGSEKPISEVTDPEERQAVKAAARTRMEESEERRISEVRKKSVHDRWRRRQFYVDVEEGATAPLDYIHDFEPPSLANDEAAGTPSTASDSRPPSHRSRSSSKVRFQDDYLTDTDYEAETRSNHSNSSRSIPIAERWGGYRMRESEKDVGKEILYQASQQGLNELLDALFKPKEDMYIEAENTVAERKKYKDKLDTLEAEQPPTTATLNAQILEAQTGLLLRSHSPIPTPAPPPGNTAPTSSQILESLIRNSHPSSSPSPPPSSSESFRDPTFPQFRPNTPPASSSPSPSFDPSISIHVTTPNPPQAEPSTQQLHRYLLLRRVEAEAKERRGGGRLDYREFEEVMNGELGRKLAFVGQWIDLASYWCP